MLEEEESTSTTDDEKEKLLNKEWRLIISLRNTNTAAAEGSGLSARAITRW